MSQAKPLANTVYQVGVNQGVCKRYGVTCGKTRMRISKTPALGNEPLCRKQQ